MRPYDKHWPSMFKRSDFQNLQHGNSSLTGGHDEERTSKPPKPRWIPRPEQIKILEEIFNSGMMNPPREEIKKIHERLKEYGPIAQINVFYWFQNRKARKYKQTQPNNMIPRKRKSKNSVAQTIIPAQTITPPLNSFSSSSSHHQNAFPNEIVVPNHVEFPTNNGVVNLTNDTPNDTIFGNQNLAADYFHTPNQTDFQLPAPPLFSLPSQFPNMTQQLPQNEIFMNYANSIPMNDNKYDQGNIQDQEVAMNMMQQQQQQHIPQLHDQEVAMNMNMIQQQQQKQQYPQLQDQEVAMNMIQQQQQQYPQLHDQEVAMNMNMIQQQQQKQQYPQLHDQEVAMNMIQQQQQQYPQLHDQEVAMNMMQQQQHQQYPQLHDQEVAMNMMQQQQKQQKQQQQQQYPQLQDQEVAMNMIQKQQQQQYPQLHGQEVAMNMRQKQQQQYPQLHDQEVAMNMRQKQQQQYPQLHDQEVAMNMRQKQQQQYPQLHDQEVAMNMIQQQPQQYPQLIGSSVTSNSLNDDSDLPPLPPIVIEAPVADPFSITQFQGVGEPDHFPAKCIVSINNEIVEVDAGPFNIRQIFGDEAILVDSFGQLVLTDEWGVTLDSLQHGASYFLI